MYAPLLQASRLVVARALNCRDIGDLHRHDCSAVDVFHGELRTQRWLHLAGRQIADVGLKLLGVADANHGEIGVFIQPKQNHTAARAVSKSRQRLIQPFRRTGPGRLHLHVIQFGLPVLNLRDQAFKFFSNHVLLAPSGSPSVTGSPVHGISPAWPL